MATIGNYETIHIDIDDERIALCTFNRPLVNRIVPDAEVVQSAYEIAKEIVANSEAAVRLSKLTLNSIGAANTRSGMHLEAGAQAILFDDEEKNRRMTAFLEGRRNEAP